MKDLTKYISISNRLNFNLMIEENNGQHYNGFYRAYGKVLKLVNIDESRQASANYNGETLTFKYTVKSTFAHELTHHLQHIDNKYQGMDDLGYIPNDKHRNGIYAYNEIVANTVAMLLYPTEDGINDNIWYVNYYLKEVASTGRNANKQAFNDRLNNDLKKDIDRYYNIIKKELELEGLL